MGRLVDRVVDGERNAGRQSIVWPGRAASGRALSSGVYVYRFRVDGMESVGHMTLLK
jgi:hypothetical protein